RKRKIELDAAMIKRGYSYLTLARTSQLRRRDPSHMESKEREASSVLRGNECVAVTFIIILTVALAYYLRIFEYGLYEDDYFYVGDPLGWDLRTAFENAAADLQTWPQGRPVGFAVPRLLAFASGALAGIPGVYLVCSAIIIGNGLITYRF